MTSSDFCRVACPSNISECCQIGVLGGRLGHFSFFPGRGEEGGVRCARKQGASFFIENARREGSFPGEVRGREGVRGAFLGGGGGQYFLFWSRNSHPAFVCGLEVRVRPL